jgi:inorganic triphosphatase YgiF
MPSHEGARPTETEATLVVVSDAPEEVTRAVAALTGLDGFALLERPDEAIHDRYFDTGDRRLEAARTALRLRQVDPRLLLSIKGPSRPAELGGRIRDELEAEWSGRGWALLREELGAALGIQAAAPPAADPFEALRSAGLVVVQDRETSRRVRAVVPAGREHAVAELAVDSVVFHLGAVDARHHEVEVEAKAAGGDAAVGELAAALVARFAPSLRPWHYGKLTTGSVVGALIAEHGADEVLTAGGSLRPSTYDAIADRLARR